MIILLFLFSTLLIKCKGNTDDSVKDNLSDTVRQVSSIDTSIQGMTHPMSGIEFDSVAIPRFLARFPEFRDFSTDITAFYRNRAYNYAWFDKDGLGEPAQILLDKLNQESIDGIAINPPYKDTLQNMFHVGDFTERPEHIRPDVNGELMLTGQYLLLAKKIWAGAYSKNLVSIGWNIPRKKLSYQELLEKLAASY
jgi:hypothetical protein